MKVMLNIFLFCITLLNFYSCATDPEDKKLALSFEDASCTEVWLNVTGETGKEIRLTRDGNEVKRFTLTSSPMTVFDDSLTVKTNYSYQAVRMDNGEKSSNVAASTLDTTSHNFTWQTWTFDGDAGSCTLYDVGVINENNIWAVGEIYKKDTSENGYSRYNAVHWDGNEWELKKISVDFRGNQIVPPIEGVQAFSNKDIWFVASLPIHGDGNNWTMYDVRATVNPNLSLSKAWGSKSDNIYFVGNSGSIAHYQNGQWTKIESGTDLQLVDIYGSENKETGNFQILAPASRNFPAANAILEIVNNTCQKISTEPIPWELFSLWFIPNRHYYLGGSGIYEKQILSDSLWRNNPTDITHYGITKIRGNGLNDLFAVGAFGEVLHFNGYSWKSYRNETVLTAGSYSGLYVKNNLIVACGYNGQKAVIIIGRL